MFLNENVTMKKLFFLCVSLFAMLPSFGSIVINEVMPKNICSSLDDNLLFSGWAELYNSGSEAVDVSSYFLTDTSAIADKWRIEAEGTQSEKSVIPPGGFLVIYLDGSTEEPLPFHASFKLPAKKGALYLFDESGRQIDRMVYDTTYRNVSYGRVGDGEKSFGFLLKATPGASNNGVQTSKAQTPAPSFDLKPGFYNGEQSVRISDADASAEIFYTTDGSEPTKEKGTLYNGPVSISKNTPLRAAAYRDGQFPSNVTSATYFIDERNINLPVVAIVSDPEYLYGDELGLLVAGKNGSEVPSYCSGPDFEANYWNDWDRPANFELFDGNKAERLNQEVKIGNFGACSRTKYVKSIKVNAAKIYGDNELDYPIFKEKPNLRWKSIVLRNSGNDFGRSYLRDGFLQTAASCLDIDHQAYQPSVVFVNGVYYGMLNIRERTNKDFIFSNHGFGDDEFYLNEGSHAHEGTTYDQVLGLAGLSAEEINTPENYANINRIVDINEFLNYFLAEIYVVNRDWPGGNIKAWRPKRPGRWRWILYDTDFGFSLYEQNYNSRSIATLANKSATFKGLMQNEKIKNRFLAKCCVHLATTFSADRMNKILDSLLNNVRTEAEYYAKYLSDHKKIEKPFEDDINSIRTFIDKRVPYIYRDIKSTYGPDSLRTRIFSSVKGAKFTLNEEPINMNDFSGLYFQSTPCEIEAIAPTGYVFDHWVVTRDGVATTVNAPLISDTACADSYEAIFKEDASYDPNVNRILFNEICTKNSVYLDDYRQTEDWIEFYNAGKEDVDMAGLFLSSSIDSLGKYEIPSGHSKLTTIPADGFLVVWADNDPEQGVLHANFKLPFTESKTLFLSKKVNGSFVILDSVTYQLHERHDSYARFVEDGKTSWKITNVVTFAAPNLPPTAVSNSASDGLYLSVYPNPFSDRLFVSAPADEVLHVRILSLMGETLVDSSLLSGESVDVADLTPGIYVLLVETSEGTVAAKVLKR